MQKKTIFSLAGLTIAALAAFLIFMPALAQDEGGFTESFDDPQLPGWERSPEAIVVDGVLRVSPENFALRTGDWAVLTLSVRVRRSGQGEIVIGYYFQEEDTYALHIFDDAILLERVKGGTPTLLGEASLENADPDNWLNLRVVVEDGQHEIFVDEESMLKATDADPLAPGGILFTVGGETAGEFDDLVVTTGVVQPEAEPTPLGEAPTADTIADETPGEGFGSLFEDLFASQADPLELQTFVINLALAAVLSFVLSRVYIHWGTSLSNRRKFAANFMMMTITTTFIILVVRSSVALSLGLVGALSIVRFRAAIKDPEELTYLFMAIGLGIGLGDNQRLITFMAFSSAIIVLGLMRFLRRSQADVNLHLTVSSHNPGKISLEDLMRVLDAHTSKLKLLRYDENEKTLEMAFLLEFKKISNLSQAQAAIRELSDSVDITFLDNKGIW